jgi:outer membrane protein assembly factor BamB
MQKYLKVLNRVWRGVLPIAVFAGLSGGAGAALAQPAQIVIDDTRVFPESLTSTRDGTVIIGSMVHGTVYRAAPGLAKATPWIAAGPNGLGRVLGVFADEAADTLFVCSNDPDPKGNKAELRTFDLGTGSAKGSYPFENGGLCNDIAVARDGTIFVTDTRGGRILTLKPGAAALGVWAADTKWVGIDGIVVMGDGAILFNNVRENQLVRVAMKPNRTAGAATLLSLSQPLAAPDGMRTLPDGRIILAENRGGKIDLVKVEGDNAKIDTIGDGFGFTPTAVTVVGDTAWVLEARFAYLNDPALKDKNPGSFGATALRLPDR